MMWTVASPESWMGQAEQTVAAEEVVCCGGIWMSVVRSETGGYRIRRVLSTDPKDYLRDSIAPGTVFR